jgi:hypothetical protein
MSKIKKIKAESELPEWYNQEKYKGFKNASPAIWYKAIAQRTAHLFFIQALTRPTYLSRKSLYPNLLKLRKDPFFIPQDKDDLMILGGVNLWALEKKPSKFSKFIFAITPITLRSLYQKERFLKDDLRLKMRKYTDSLYDNPENSEIDNAVLCEKYIDEPLFDVLKTQGDFKKNRQHVPYMRTRDVVDIDFSLPNKILIEQFEKYLIQTRENYPDIIRPSSHKRPSYIHWYNYGLIQYLDLKIWEHENNFEITNRIMADAIFINTDLDAETVRKTTRKIANQITQNGYLDFLARLIAEDEIDTKKSGKK